MERLYCSLESVVGMMLDFYKGKKVFITGHTGFKGSWLCKLLANAGADVTGYSLNPPTSPSLFEIANIESDVKSVIGDIRDFDSLKRHLMRHSLRLYFILRLSRLCVTATKCLHIHMKQMLWERSTFLSVYGSQIV